MKSKKKLFKIGIKMHPEGWSTMQLRIGRIGLSLIKTLWEFVIIDCKCILNCLIMTCVYLKIWSIQILWYVGDLQQLKYISLNDIAWLIRLQNHKLYFQLIWSHHFASIVSCRPSLSVNFFQKSSPLQLLSQIKTKLGLNHPFGI